MTDNQLPGRLRKAITEIRRKPYPSSDLIPLLSAAADALQARAKVQGEPVTVAVDHFDNGPFEAYTNRIYPHVEIGTKLYTAPQPAQATQAEVADEQILEVAEPFGEFQYGDAQGHKRIDFARAILALRPERVPMTEDQVWHNDALMSANGTAGFKMDALMRIVRAAEAHHGITARAKKEDV